MTETTTTDVRERLIAQEDGRINGNGLAKNEDIIGPAGDVRLTALEDFAATEEPGADALVGSEDDALIPEGGDVMFYGDGGAGKTTLSIDLACHLATAQDWLDIRVPRTARVMLIENEGPRPLFRKKLRRKLGAWGGPSFEGRISVFEDPWGRFSFASAPWRDKLATMVTDNEIDVLMVGPVTRAGMDEAGTLQQVRDFMELVAEVRAQSGRRLTVILVHHESKSGAVSGAWEGSGDTLLHVEARGHGLTALHVQKARWSSTHHKSTLELAWTAGEGFLLKGERDYIAEIAELLADGKLRTAKEIAAPKEAANPGIGAAPENVRETLDGNPDRFESRTGDRAKEAGRNPNARVWGVVSRTETTGTTLGFSKGVQTGVICDFPLRGITHPESPPALAGGSELGPEITPNQLGRPEPAGPRAFPDPAAVHDDADPDAACGGRVLEKPTNADAEYDRITAKFGEELDGEAA